MQREGQHLEALGAERHRRPGDADPPIAHRGGVRLQLQSDHLAEVHGLPAGLADQALDATQGGEPLRQRPRRVPPAERLHDHGLHHVQEVAGAMLQLGDQSALADLGLDQVGDVDEGRHRPVDPPAPVPVGRQPHEVVGVASPRSSRRSTAWPLARTLARSASRSGRAMRADKSVMGRPRSLGSRLNTRVAAGVKLRMRSAPSRKTVAGLVLSNR